MIDKKYDSYYDLEESCYIPYSPEKSIAYSTNDYYYVKVYSEKDKNYLIKNKIISSKHSRYGDELKYMQGYTIMPRDNMRYLNTIND